MMTLFLRLLDLIPLAPEQVIWCLRIAGVVAGLLSIRSIFRASYLSHSLTISEAKRYLRIRKKPMPPVRKPEDPQMTVQLEPIQPRPKKAPITFFLSEDAQAFLDKFTVSVDNGAGWLGCPEN